MPRPQIDAPDHLDFLRMVKCQPAIQVRLLSPPKNPLIENSPGVPRVPGHNSFDCLATDRRSDARHDIIRTRLTWYCFQEPRMSTPL
jgi:hypothetical protein